MGWDIGGPALAWLGWDTPVCWLGLGIPVGWSSRWGVPVGWMGVTTLSTQVFTGVDMYLATATSVVDCLVFNLLLLLLLELDTRVGHGTLLGSNKIPIPILALFIFSIKYQYQFWPFLFFQ